ncbi:hypothetical protein GA0115239_11231, partial [Streptomyces sp. BpilaLS-43]
MLVPVLAVEEDQHRKIAGVPGGQGRFVRPHAAGP